MTTLLSKLWGGNKYIVECMRKEGMSIGKDTHIFSNIASCEPYLITIGDNCTISTDVTFITHDASIGVFLGRSNSSDICGRISIGNNVFIGNKSILLYGINIPDNTIIAAGSVVTKSYSENGCVLAGNPARIIGSISDFLEKNRPYFMNLHGKNFEMRKRTILNSHNLIQR